MGKLRSALVLGAVLLAVAVGWLRSTSLLSLVRFLRETDNRGTAFDNREERLLQHVLSTAPAGDAAAVVQAIDAYAWWVRVGEVALRGSKEWFMNVGDVKGRVLDGAVQSAGQAAAGLGRELRILELGTYCGYSAIRTVSKAPKGTRLWTLDVNPKVADVAARMVQHAGLGDHITQVMGPLQGAVGALEAVGPFDVVFIDHSKDHYLSDLQLIMRSGLLAHGARVVADNILIPGAPEYKAWLKSPAGVAAFNTVFYDSHLEYVPRWLPFNKDQVAVSVYKG